MFKISYVEPLDKIEPLQIRNVSKTSKKELDTSLL